MKAIVQYKYGPPDDVLQLREIDKPVTGDDQVLVRVRAASVHPKGLEEKETRVEQAAESRGRAASMAFG